MKASIVWITAQFIMWCCPALSTADSRWLDVCVDYHCDRTQPVMLRNDDWTKVRALFLGIDTPERERQQLRRAIALLESIVGQLTGTWRDRGKNAAGAETAGQLDCISESKNTTSYLQLIEQERLLHWHQVRERAVRNPWILDYHWTAVIEDRTTGIRYAVDSWYLDNGQPPYIQNLKDWLAKRSFPKQSTDPDT